MIVSYSGAFAKPTLHHMAVAVAGPEQLVDAIRGQDALAVPEVGIAAKAGLQASVQDVAPASAGDPSGTVEFYAIIFISIGASVGATLIGRMMGTVRRHTTLALRTVTLAGYSALLAGGVTLYVDTILGALTGSVGRCSARSGCTRSRSAGRSPESPRRSGRSRRWR